MESSEEIAKRIMEQTRSRLNKTNEVLITTRQQNTIFDKEVETMRKTLKQQEEELERQIYMKKVELSWNVMLHDFNADKIVKYDVLKNNDYLVDRIKKAIKSKTK